MKTTLLLAATVAAFTAVNSASAAEPLRSPRASADLVPTVPGVTVDKLARSLPLGSPKGREMAYSVRVVPSSGTSIDIAHGPRPSLSPRDPRYEQVARELRAPEFQVAPLKCACGRKSVLYTEEGGRLTPPPGTLLL